jgi:DNA processing protein
MIEQRTTPLNDEEKLSWLQLIRTENIGAVTFYQLLQKYGSASAALEALPEISQKTARKKPLIIPQRDLVAREIEAIVKFGGTILAACDPTYPLSLASLEDAPPILTVAGRLELLNKPSVAIVGSRNASLNGRRFAEHLAQDLGQHDIVVTSGLARGIDTAAHQGSLAGGTIAVLAGGINIVYPPENMKLYENIRESGVILAECAFHQQPFAQSFPRRNRIISGLSMGVCVVEANMKSGSLITARMAAEQGRDVYAVPGHPMDPRAGGTNHLIREGATLVRDAADILETLRHFNGQMRDSAPQEFWGAHSEIQFHAFAPIESEDAKTMIYDQIGFTAVSIDDLIRLSGLPVGQVQGTLMDLELDGFVQRLPGNRVIRLSQDARLII